MFLSSRGLVNLSHLFAEAGANQQSTVAQMTEELVRLLKPVFVRHGSKWNTFARLSMLQILRRLRCIVLEVFRAPIKKVRWWC